MQLALRMAVKWEPSVSTRSVHAFLDDRDHGTCHAHGVMVTTFNMVIILEAANPDWTLCLNILLVAVRAQKGKCGAPHLQCMCIQHSWLVRSFQLTGSF